MNLGEAIAHVIKTRGGNLLQEFVKDDLASVIGGVITEGAKLYRDGRAGVRNFSLRTLPGDVMSSAGEVAKLLRELPKRIITALTDFQRELLLEIERLPGKKEKAIFCLRVLGILTSSSFSTFYNLKKTGKGLSPGTLRLRGAFAQFLLAEILLRSLRKFVFRLLGEIESELTVPEDLENVRYFRRLLDEGGATEEFQSIDESDPAFRVTEKFRRSIFGGDDES